MINFRKEKNIHPCYLSKEDLETLVGLIKSDFPSSKRIDDFKIRAYTNRVDVSENTLDAFLDHGELPSILTDLSIDATGWSVEGGINKSLDLIFHNNFINLRVSGSSETWVNGKFLQIVSFLKKTRPFLWFLHTTIAYFVLGAIITPVLISIALLVKRISEEGFDFIAIISILGVLFLGSLVLIGIRHKYVQIFLKEKRSFFNKHKDVIIFLSFIVYILGLISSIIIKLWFES